MDKYQKEEARDKKILSQQIERRMQALENVKGVIEQRQAVKSRQEECRAIQSYVQQQKKTVELERRKERKKRSRSRVDSKLSKLNSSGRNRPVTVNNDDQQEIDSSDNLQLKSTSNVVGDQDQGNLPSILRSLDQLVVLESRIKSLEENNLHQNLMREGAISDPSIMRKIPSMKTRSVSNRNGSHFSSSSIPQRGSSVQLSFSKRHTHSQPKNPSRPYYTASVLPPSRANSARPSLESNQHNITQRPLTVGARLREARTFLTQIPRGTNKNAFSGKRYSTPIAESDRFMTRNHHNLLGKENIRVNDPTNRIQKGKSKIQIKKTTRGSHLGIKTSNPHLREFHRIREEHLKRKGMLFSLMGEPLPYLFNNFFHQALFFSIIYPTQISFRNNQLQCWHHQEHIIEILIEDMILSPARNDQLAHSLQKASQNHIHRCEHNHHHHQWCLDLLYVSLIHLKVLFAQENKQALALFRKK